MIRHRYIWIDGTSTAVENRVVFNKTTCAAVILAKDVFVIKNVLQFEKWNYMLVVAVNAPFIVSYTIFWTNNVAANSAKLICSF